MALGGKEDREGIRQLTAETPLSGQRNSTLVNIVRADVHGHNAISFDVKNDPQIAFNIYRIDRSTVMRGKAANLVRTETRMALMFLNGDVMREGRAHYTIEGVPLIGERRTAPLYRFYSVRDEFPSLYPAAEGGQPVLGELYDVPMGPLSALLATEPPELELSIIELQDGELSFAMVLREAEHALGIHKDITSYGGWRAYRAASLSEGPDKRRTQL